MKGWRLGIGRWIVIAGLLGVMVGLRAGAAQQSSASARRKTTPVQQTQASTLQEILQRLEENLDQYDSRVPSFFCDEHVVSKRSPDPHLESRVTDSTFRLKRVANPGPDGKPILEESREVKRVNGKPANGESLSGPTTVRGAFSGGLALVSLSQQSCMSYKLLPIKQGDSRKPYIVQFASVPASERPDDCLMQEDISGRVLIDPATMQIKRMELHAPHHLIVPGGRTSAGGVIPQVVGVWDRHHRLHARRAGWEELLAARGDQGEDERQSRRHGLRKLQRKPGPLTHFIQTGRSTPITATTTGWR